MRPRYKPEKVVSDGESCDVNMFARSMGGASNSQNFNRYSKLSTNHHELMTRRPQRMAPLGHAHDLGGPRGKTDRQLQALSQQYSGVRSKNAPRQHQNNDIFQRASLPQAIKVTNQKEEDAQYDTSNLLNRMDARPQHIQYAKLSQSANGYSMVQQLPSLKKIRKNNLVKMNESYTKQTRQKKRNQRSPYDEKASIEKMQNVIMGRGGGFVTAFSSEECRSMDSPMALPKS